MCKSFVLYFQQNEWILWRINANNYLTLVSNNESKYGELWNKIKDLIRFKTKISDDYIEKPLNKTIEIPAMTIASRAVFYEDNKYYPQVFWDEQLCKFSLSD